MSIDAPSPASAPEREILGGDAWVVPYEDGGPVWITTAAPEIRVLDLRAERSSEATPPLGVAVPSA